VRHHAGLPHVLRNVVWAAAAYALVFAVTAAVVLGLGAGAIQ
jgi:hypothetical protein